MDSALAEAKRAVAEGCDAHELGAHRRLEVALGEQAVAFAHQQVAHIDRRCNAMGSVQGRLAVAQVVLVLELADVRDHQTGRLKGAGGLEEKDQARGSW